VEKISQRFIDSIIPSTSGVVNVLERITVNMSNSNTAISLV